MRLTAKILVAAGTIAFLTCWALEVAEYLGVGLSSEVRAREAAMVRKRKQRDDFNFHAEWIARELADSRISLREGSRLLEAAAAEHWPAFLTHAEMIDAPGSLRAKLALSLLRQLQIDMPSVSGERRAEIEREYRAIAAEESRGLENPCNLAAGIL